MIGDGAIHRSPRKDIQKPTPLICGRDSCYGSLDGILPSDCWSRAAAALRLTTKDVEVLQALFRGDNEKEAAARLGVARRTFHGRLERLHVRLGVRSRVELLLRILLVALAQRPTTTEAEVSRGGRVAK